MRNIFAAWLTIFWKNNRNIDLDDSIFLKTLHQFFFSILNPKNIGRDEVIIVDLKIRSSRFKKNENCCFWNERPKLEMSNVDEVDIAKRLRLELGP